MTHAEHVDFHSRRVEDLSFPLSLDVGVRRFGVDAEIACRGQEPGPAEPFLRSPAMDADLFRED